MPVELMGGVTGSCYCRAIEFKIEFPTEFCSHCHCESCRKSHGAPFVTWSSVPLKQFSIVKGRDKLKIYNSSPKVRWEFCGECGSSLFYEHEDAPGRIYFTLSHLDGPLDQRPRAHYSYEERVDWFHVNDTLPKFREKTDQQI